MADQKSIFDAFSTPDTSSTPEPSSPSTTQSLSPSTDSGGSIFSAFSSQPKQSQTSFPSPDLQRPVNGQKQSGSIFSAFEQETINQPEKQNIVQSNGEPANQDDPWYKKAWNAVNEPLFDQTTAKNWFGWDVHSWGGLGEGFFDLMSGLTSPLQLALTIGTFGSSSLLDAGGVAALKAAGWATKDIEAVVSGSGMASKLIKAGHDSDMVWKGLASSGFDIQKISEGLDVIKASGLTPESLVAQGVIRRAGASALRQAGMDVGMAENVGTWTQSAIDAGFTVQNAYAAAITSPRVFDAIKEGDYETAKKLAVEAAGMGLFAGLGAHQAVTHAGELMPDAAAKMGLRVKPSEENLKLIKEFETHDRENIINSEAQKQWEKDIRKRYGDLEFDDMQRSRFLYEAGSNKNNLSDWYNAVSESAGKDSRKGIILSKPIGKKSIYNPSAEVRTISENGKTIGELHTTIKGDNANIEWVGEPIDGDSVLNKLYGGEAIEQLKNKIGTSNVRSLLRQFSDQNPEIKNLTGERISGASAQSGLDVRDVNLPLEKDDSRIHIREAIDKAKLKEKPAEYIDRLLNQLDPDKLTDRHTEFSKEIADHFSKTLEKAKTAGVLSEGAGNYITRIFKNPENDTVRRFRSTAQGSGFSTYTSMARKRMFDTTLEGLLNGHELADYDPIALAAHNGNEFGRVAIAKDTLERLRESGVRASDGRPMVALSGSGHAMIDEKGNRIGTAVQPGRAQSLRITKKVIEGLQNNITKEAKFEADEKIKIPFEGSVVNIPSETFYSFQDEWHNLSHEEKLKYGDYRQTNTAYDNFVKEKLGEEKIKPGKLLQPEITELDKLMKEGRVVKFGVDKKTSEQLYAWTTHDYRDVANPSFKGWASRVQDSEGNPIYVESDLKAHPEAYEYLNRRFGTQESIVSKIPGMKTLLKLGQEAKGILLFGSPFHLVQEGMRALMTGISPFGHVEFDANNPIHRLAAEKGVWEGREYKGAQAFQEGLAGHSKLISKIPGLAQIQDWQQKLLFDRYIPSLKLRAFEKLNERYAKAYPDWNADKAANVAAADTANRFGGIPYKRIGRAAGTMDAARIMALAPDWLESEMRFMGSLFGEQGKITRRDTAKMAVGLWTVSRVLNALVNNGNTHNEAPFGVAVKGDDGREKVYSIRSMPGDLLHAASDPEGFLRGRVSPIVRTGIQTYTGRDEFGRKLPEHGLWVNALRNISPIGVQSTVKKMTGEDSGISAVDAATKALGATVFQYRTEAQKLAAKIASDHSESGPVDQEKMRRHSAVLNLEDKIRAGEAPITTIHQLVEEGQLHVSEAKTIEKNVKETAGMDQDMARLYMHASRAPMPDMIKIWESSTNHEKALLTPLLLKKKQAYLKKAIKDMSQQERSSDKTYQWLRGMFPQDSPWGGSSGTNVTSSGATSDKNKPSLFTSQPKNAASDEEPPAPVIAGQTIDSVGKAFDLFKGRNLNSSELAKVSPIFEKLLDLGQIKIHEVPQQVMDYLAEGKGVYAIQNKERKNDVALTSDKKFLSTSPISEEAIIGHEITHVYQSQGGVSSEQFENKFGDSPYKLPNAKNMIALHNNGVKFKDFTTEQQGAIVGNYIHLVNSIDNSKSFGDEDKKSYIHSLQPYIDDLRSSQSYKPSMQLESAVKNAASILEDVKKGVFKKLGIF